MEVMSRSMQELEFGLDFDPAFEPGYLSASWDWKGISGFYVLGQPPPPPQSLSPAPSSESLSSSSESCPSSYFSSSLAGPLAGTPGAPCGGSVSGYADPQEPGKNRGHRKSKKMPMTYHSRKKASEREKMRMRNLAEALHTLRDYLPANFSREGHPLTKVQTLRCSIAYIKALTDTLNEAREA